jgi:hypothetical protein
MVNPPRLVSVLKLALKTLLLVGLKVAHFCSRCTQLTAGTVRRDAGTVWQDAGTVRQDAGTVRQDVGTVRRDAGTVRERVAEFAQAHLHHSLAQLFGKARLQSHTEMRIIM